MNRLMPRQRVPALVVDTIDGHGFDLAKTKPDRFAMIVFYRGLHCAVCNTYIRELDGLHEEFTRRGIEPIAISSDTRDRALETQSKWGLANVKLGYELPIEKAREWNLYVSSSRGRATNGIEEPPVFSEPGIFVVRPDRTLYWGSISTMPFARPHFNEMLQAFDLVQKIDYPARGEL
jgi:alkyl hydroperoxide reductase subunit AhpC